MNFETIPLELVICIFEYLPLEKQELIVLLSRNYAHVFGPKYRKNRREQTLTCFRKFALFFQSKSIWKNCSPDNKDVAPYFSFFCRFPKAFTVLNNNLHNFSSFEITILNNFEHYYKSHMIDGIKMMKLCPTLESSLILTIHRSSC